MMRYCFGRGADMSDGVRVLGPIANGRDDQCALAQLKKKLARRYANPSQLFYGLFQNVLLGVGDG
jgi:hypothetical protein